MPSPNNLGQGEGSSRAKLLSPRRSAGQLLLDWFFHNLTDCQEIEKSGEGINFSGAPHTVSLLLEGHTGHEMLKPLESAADDRVITDLVMPDDAESPHRTSRFGELIRPTNLLFSMSPGSSKQMRCPAANLRQGQVTSIFKPKIDSRSVGFAPSPVLTGFAGPAVTYHLMLPGLLGAQVQP
jgi:hypothetical protein